MVEILETEINVDIDGSSIAFYNLPIENKGYTNIFIAPYKFKRFAVAFLLHIGLEKELIKEFLFEAFYTSNDINAYYAKYLREERRFSLKFYWDSKTFDILVIGGIDGEKKEPYKINVGFLQNQFN